MQCLKGGTDRGRCDEVKGAAQWFLPFYKTHTQCLSHTRLTLGPSGQSEHKLSSADRGSSERKKWTRRGKSGCEKVEMVKEKEKQLERVRQKK